MARKIPFDDPQVLTYVRIAYVVVQAIVLGVYYFITLKVRFNKAFELAEVTDYFVMPDQAEERPDCS